MKRLGMLLLATLLTTTTSFSLTISQDTIVSITPKQLKETNLIFIEHDKLLTENKLLCQQLNNYKLDNSILIRNDSIRLLQIDAYKKLSSSYNDKCIQLNKQLDKKNKKVLGWRIGGVTVSIGLILLLIFK